MSDQEIARANAVEQSLKPIIEGCAKLDEPMRSIVIGNARSAAFRAYDLGVACGYVIMPEEVRFFGMRIRFSAELPPDAIMMVTQKQVAVVSDGKIVVVALRDHVRPGGIQEKEEHHEATG